MAVRLRHRLVPSWMLGAIVATAAVAGGPAALGQARAAPTESEVKAAFLYHFAQLVTWPERPDPAAAPRPIVVALVGHDPFGAGLEATIGQETVRGRPLAIKRFARASDLGEPPHILYVGADDLAEAGRVLAAVAGQPVLTVGDLKGFARRGGMVEFRLTPDARVAFDINLRAVERSGLRMSSQLLKLARVVEPAP